MREILVNSIGLVVRYVLPVIGIYWLARLLVMLMFPVAPEIQGALALVLTGVAILGWQRKDD